MIIFLSRQYILPLFVFTFIHTIFYLPFAGGNNNNIPRASPVTGTLGMVQSYSRMAIYLCIVLYLVPFTGIQQMCYKVWFNHTVVWLYIYVLSLSDPIYRHTTHVLQAMFSLPFLLVKLTFPFSLSYFSFHFLSFLS